MSRSIFCKTNEDKSREKNLRLNTKKAMRKVWRSHILTDEFQIISVFGG